MKPKMRSRMKNTRTTMMVTAAGAAWMLLAATGCSSSTNEPPNNDAGTDTGVDTAPPPPPVPIDVVAAGVRWVGRVDSTTDAAHPSFSWSGTGFVAKFMGTSLTAQLTTTGTNQIQHPDQRWQPVFGEVGFHWHLDRFRHLVGFDGRLGEIHLQQCPRSCLLA